MVDPRSAPELTLLCSGVLAQRKTHREQHKKSAVIRSSGSAQQATRKETKVQAIWSSGALVNKKCTGVNIAVFRSSGSAKDPPGATSKKSAVIRSSGSAQQEN